MKANFQSIWTLSQILAQIVALHLIQSQRIVIIKWGGIISKALFVFDNNLYYEFSDFCIILQLGLLLIYIILSTYIHLFRILRDSTWEATDTHNFYFRIDFLLFIWLSITLSVLLSSTIHLLFDRVRKSKYKKVNSFSWLKFIDNLSPPLPVLFICY